MKNQNWLLLALVLSASALAQLPDRRSTLLAPSWNHSEAPLPNGASYASGNDDSSQTSSQTDPVATGSSHWIRRWLDSVDQARANQPHFVSPIVTTHVMLVQQYRYDIGWQRGAPGSGSNNYGSSRGLEIIPTTRLEIGLFPPSYVTHKSMVANGLGIFRSK